MKRKRIMKPTVITWKQWTKQLLQDISTIDSMCPATDKINVHFEAKIDLPNVPAIHLCMPLSDVKLILYNHFTEYSKYMGEGGLCCHFDKSKDRLAWNLYGMSVFLMDHQLSTDYQTGYLDKLQPAYGFVYHKNALPYIQNRLKSNNSTDSTNSSSSWMSIARSVWDLFEHTVC